jgi:nitrite reductase (NADH) large subunit
VVFGEEPRPAYDRIHLTDLLTGRDRDSLLLAPVDWYREHGMTLHLNHRVAAIDRARRTVVDEDGTEVPYDHLILATGSRAFVPPIPGSDLPGVFVYRTIRDLEAIRQTAAHAKRAAVVGGGLLGLEAARAMGELGLKTHVIEHGSGLMARQLSPEGSAILKCQVETLGLQVRLNTETRCIKASDAERVLVFGDEDSLAVDLVILAAGIRPRDELARDAGLTIGPRGGVDVDDRLRSSDPAICAIGECASHRGIIYGLASPGYKMANALAVNFSGGRAKFAGDDLSTRLKLLGVDVTILGEFQGNGSTVKVQQEGVFRELVLQGGKLIGATGVGAWPELNRVQEAVEARRRVWPWQVNRFRASGRLWPDAASVHVSQWPASALVCHCMRVPRGALTRAVNQEGCRTMETLVKTTGASTVCGSCRPLLVELLGERSARRPARGARVLLAASLASVAGMCLILALRPWPFAATVQGDWKWDALWRSGVLKQTTGYVLLGLIALSLALSLRKRLRWFVRIDFGWWRMMHAVLGTVSLIALVTHTGLRLGHHLNFVLMLNFAALVVMGGLAGALAALESKWEGPWPRRVRAWWTTGHMLLFWPLPILLLFHVLKAYYY